MGSGANGANGNTVSTTGNLIFGGNMRCYPNPVSELLYLEFTPGSIPVTELRAVLYDATGRQVLHPMAFPASGIHEIPVRSLDAGFYALRLSDPNGHTSAIHFVKIN